MCFLKFTIEMLSTFYVSDIVLGVLYILIPVLDLGIFIYFSRISLLYRGWNRNSGSWSDLPKVTLLLSTRTGIQV